MGKNDRNRVNTKSAREAKALAREFFDMEAHVQVPVKVNALVDEGIAPLITALSSVKGLVALESCQGGDGNDAYVIFRLGDWREAGSFLFERLLPAMSPDLRSMTALRLQAYDEEMAQATISVDHRATSLLAQCITDVMSVSDHTSAWTESTNHVKEPEANK